MPRAEVGSTKFLNNKLKSRGLQRLRWFCQVCERQMRDENGFKCHVQSESHVRQMLLVGEDPRKYIEDYSNQFQRDFLQLLRTSHGEKKININHFYQEYIANKLHVHMNATRWSSLTDFAKYLGREGICRVEETEKGLMVSWIDNSPEALRRQDAIRKKERQDRGDEERERHLIEQQVKQAQLDAAERQNRNGWLDHQTEGDDGAGEPSAQSLLPRQDGEKIKLSFLPGRNKNSGGDQPAIFTTPDENLPSPISRANSEPVVESSISQALPTTFNIPSTSEALSTDSATIANHAIINISSQSSSSAALPSPRSSGLVQSTTKLGFISTSKPKNVFAAANKNQKKKTLTQPTSGHVASQDGSKGLDVKRPMSQAERIMREEMEQRQRKRARITNAAPSRPGLSMASDR